MRDTDTQKKSMQAYFIQDMDPEKTPLLSTAKETIDGMWDEKTAVPYT